MKAAFWGGKELNEYLERGMQCYPVLGNANSRETGNIADG